MAPTIDTTIPPRRPRWHARRLFIPHPLTGVASALRELGLSTVCREARCPNAGECFSRSTVTFLILGNHCTRSCAFCAVKTGIPELSDPEEPAKVAEAVRRLNITHAVITSVTRDDLHDGGAGHFAKTTSAIRKAAPGTAVELLVPDFQGSRKALETVLGSSPSVLGHNIETVPRLYPTVRPGADYYRSRELLRLAARKQSTILVKSGLMLGLGEQDDEVHAVLEDLVSDGCMALTIGQYLQPGPSNCPPVRFVPPETFLMWEEEAYSLGFKAVASGVYVRSSYHADRMLARAKGIYLT